MGSTIPSSFGTSLFRAGFQPMTTVTPRTANTTTPAAPTPAATDTFEAQSSSKKGPNLTGEPPINGTPAPPTATQAPTATAVPLEKYTVVPGDTVSGIADARHVSVEALIAVNPGVDGVDPNAGRYLHVGQSLNIPGPPPPPLTQVPTGSPDLNGSQAMVEAGEDNLLAYGTNSQNPTLFDGECLDFVANTAVQAGLNDPILSQPSAATALYEAQRQGRLYADTSQMEAGAIVFWPATSANEHEGHVAVYTGRDDAKGNPILLTSTGFENADGELTYSGVQEMTLDKLNALERTEAAGWMMPHE